MNAYGLLPVILVCLLALVGLVAVLVVAMLLRRAPATPPPSHEPHVDDSIDPWVEAGRRQGDEPRDEPAAPNNRA